MVGISGGNKKSNSEPIMPLSSMFVLDPGSTEGSTGETGRRLYPKSALADSLTMGVNGVLF